MEKFDLREEVLNVIKYHDGGIKGKELASYFGHKDTRTVRQCIESLRKEGIPICVHKTGGYFYSENPTDIKVTMGDMTSRAYEITAVAEGLGKALAKFGGVQ